MSRTSRRFLKLAGALYLAGVILFLYATYGVVALVPRPRLVGTRLAVPRPEQFAGWRARERYESAKREILEAGYLMRTAQAGLETYQQIGERELEVLIQAKVGSVLVWDPGACRRFARYGFRAAEELRDSSGNVLVRAGDLLDEERTIRLALAFDAEGGARAHDKIRVSGTGKLLSMDMTPVFVGLNFLALAAILHAALWDPVLRLIDERAQAIKEGLESAGIRRREGPQTPTKGE